MLCRLVFGGVFLPTTGVKTWLAGIRISIMTCGQD